MHASASTQRGFGLTEAMIALVVGMITVVVIMQALSNAETQRRTISGGSDTNTAGTIALQLLQRDVLNAGFGMSIPEGGSIGTDLYTTCSRTTVLAHNATRDQGDGTTLAQDIVLPAGSFLPVVRYDSRTAGAGITAPTPAYLISPDPADPASPTGFDADTDIVQVTYSGASTFLGSGVTLNNQLATTNPFAIVVDPQRRTNVSLRNGIHQGDLVIVGNSPPDSSTTPAPQPPGVATPCVISQVTHIPTTTAGTTRDECGAVTANTGDSTIWHNTGTFNNWHLNPPNCAPDTARWNRPGAPNLGVAFNLGMTRPPRLFSLGSPERFVVRAYGIRGGRLMVCNPLLQNCTNWQAWSQVAENIVSLRVMFGVDADRDGRVVPPTYQANGTINPGQYNEWMRNVPGMGGVPGGMLGTAVPPPAVAPPVPLPNPHVQWSDIRSLHVAIVSRSASIQRDNIANATCQPDWAGFPHDRTADPALRVCAGNPGDGEFWLASGYDGAAWRRYPTRVFETTMPLRSLYWSNN